jgi:hypothetical protein
MKSALPKLKRRINEINAIDPSQAVGTFTPEFSAITDNANAKWDDQDATAYTKQAAQNAGCHTQRRRRQNL